MYTFPFSSADEREKRVMWDKAGIEIGGGSRNNEPQLPEKAKNEIKNIIKEHFDEIQSWIDNIDRADQENNSPAMMHAIGDGMKKMGDLMKSGKSEIDAILTKYKVPESQSGRLMSTIIGEALQETPRMQDLFERGSRSNDPNMRQLSSRMLEYAPQRERGSPEAPANSRTVNSPEDARAKAQDAAEQADEVVQAGQTNMEKLGATEDGGTWQESAEKMAKASLELQNMFGGLRGKLTGTETAQAEISPEALAERTEAIAGLLLLVKNVKDMLDEFKSIFGDLTGEKEKDALSGSGVAAKDVPNAKKEAEAITVEGDQGTIDSLTVKKTNLTDTINKTTDAAQLTTLRAALQTVDTELIAAKRKFDLLAEQKRRETLVKTEWGKAVEASGMSKNEHGIEDVTLEGGDGNDLLITLRDDAGVTKLEEVKNALSIAGFRMEGSVIKVKLGAQWEADIAKVLGRLAGMNQVGEGLL